MLNVLSTQNAKTEDDLEDDHNMNDDLGGLVNIGVMNDLITELKE
jgi:hypothetical protein